MNGRLTRIRLARGVCHQTLIKRFVSAWLFVWLGLMPIAAIGYSFTVSGVSDEPLANVNAYLKELKSDRFSTSRLETEINRRVGRALRPFGFYRPEITVDLDPEKKTGRVDITPGSAVEIETLDIRLQGEARGDPAFVEAVDRFSLGEGDRLLHAPWKALSRRLEALALERGYLDWRFGEKRMEVRPYRQSARLFLTFDSGRRYALGETVFFGSHIETVRLERMRGFAVGDPYRADYLARFNQRLSETGWFDSVVVRPRLGPMAPVEAVEALLLAPVGMEEAVSASGLRGAYQVGALAPVVGIDVRLEPADRHVFEVGVGFATDVGPRASVGWRQPWTNAWGHALDQDLFVSGAEQRVSGRYQVPLRDPLRDSYEVQYGLVHEDDRDTRLLKTSFEVARRWALEGGWSRSVFVRSTFEDFTQAGRSEEVWVTYPGIRLSRTRSRPQRFPMWGDRQQVSVEYASEGWGSDVAFWRVTGRSEWIRSLGEDHRFIGRLGAGVIETGQFDEMPPSLRFFAGGDRSVRGYGFEALAPEDEAGRLVGGARLLTVGLEAQRRVVGDWWLAGFVDGGDAFEAGALGALKVGAGLGVRWVSPIGPIRLDLAHPFDVDEALRVHFSIGPEF